MKHLLHAIDARRDSVQLSDHDIYRLLHGSRGKNDDKIEFTEAMVRVLEELKSSEHASAFLTKVAKRDAPDYYDVIKNPMDLGTMLRNVRQGRYKNKPQFMRDLDLIWDNCLTYNSEPTHPLRRSVQILRAKANHLLTYVNDSNDADEALNQWLAASSLQRGSSDTSISGANMRVGGAGDQSSLSKKGLGIAKISVTSFIDTPFEQRPALLRNAEAMKTFEMLNSSLNDLDRKFDHQYLNPQAGPSSRTLDLPSQQSALVQRSLDMLKTLEGPQKGVLRKALTTLPEESSTSNNQQNGGNSVIEDDESSPMPYPLEPEGTEEEVEKEAYDIGAVWWNSMAHPSLLASGVSTLHNSEQLPNRRIRHIGGRPAKKRRQNGVVEEQNMDNNRLAGASRAVENNVRVITRLRRTHMKYGRLNNHIESGEPIPADLGVVSSDDEDDRDEFGYQSKQESVNRRTEKPRRKAPDALMIPLHEMTGNPYPSLSGEGASDLLQNRTNLLLAHAGFDGSQKAAADVMVDVAGEFLMNIGRTMRSYSDRFAQEMSVEELILHALFENGGIDVRSLESYVADDVVRYGNKMTDLLRKLRTSYKDTLANTDLTMADEAAYFGSAAAGMENGNAQAMTNGTMAGEEDENIIRGGYAAGLDEDFFGFKDMGLDEELGIDVGRQLAAMPSRVFARKDQDGVNGPGGMGAKNRMGGSGSSGASSLDFDPPSPFVPLTEAAISAQIELLRPFYREELRSRGQWQQATQDQERDDVEGTNSNTIEGGEESAENKNEKDAYLILPDEDQERQRYKVPPTGKLPRRAMKERSTQSTNKSSSQKTSKVNGGEATGNNANGNIRKPALSTTSSFGKSSTPAMNGNGKSSTKSKSKKKDSSSHQNGKQHHSIPTVTVS
ncbi:uncharacterized protein FA14DRAFT_46247 [Meira miltonrushii]|uniref:Bromo domain-containing protein n=1 Tax=Meira miltonrushii TaxID=1280837 RepID=A0A316VDV7_9BASI|nr:uncharacterized protein FA14DRAFT_46247 [Meira miltonrushii]PWN35736.1 hypothetical protein FA14DRAFT_46247 [Meira miltonrushii]